MPGAPCSRCRSRSARRRSPPGARGWSSPSPAASASGASAIGRRAAVALGFRVRTGVASAAIVALPGGAGAPTVRRLTDLQLSDSRREETRQPYHAGFGALETDERTIERRVEGVRAAAARSLDEFLAGVAAGPLVKRAGLVVGSLIDPAAIGNEHIRAHALEGRLFRTVLAELLTARGLAPTVFIDRTLYEETAAELGISVASLKRRVAQLPHPPGPWRAAEKAAVLAAWRILAN